MKLLGLISQEFLDKFGGTSDLELEDRNSLVSVLRVKMGVRVRSMAADWLRRL